MFLTEEAFRPSASFGAKKNRTLALTGGFVLVLLEVGNQPKAGQKLAACERIAEVLSNSIRETDIRGWYETGSSIGVIFTEVDSADGSSIGSALVTKIERLLSCKLTAHQVGKITLSFYVFPEDWDKGSKSGSAAAVLYQDSARAKKPSRVHKSAAWTSPGASPRSSSERQYFW